MRIEHISVSRYKTFQTCRQKYKYQYHLKVPRTGPEPFYFTYGTIVHKVAEEYVHRKGEIPIGEICQDLLRGKIELSEGTKCPEIPADYAKKIQKHLRAIQNLTERIGSGGLVEHQFRYDLDPPNGRHVTGFIDRLILKENKAFIIDYKTTKRGQWRVNKETVKDDLQLRMYARVVQRHFNVSAANIKCALYYLEGEELIAAQYDETSLDGVEQEMLAAFKIIEEANPDKVWGTTGWHCKQCEYNQICPFYKGQEAAPHKWDGDMDSLGGGW